MLYYIRICGRWREACNSIATADLPVIKAHVWCCLVALVRAYIGDDYLYIVVYERNRVITIEMGVIA